jgi:CBS domain-containing protein
MTLGRIRHMPVLGDGKLVGILSQRDLFRAAVSSALNFRPAAEREWLAKIRVAEVMSAQLVAAAPDWTMQRAVDAMIDGRFGCLPVVEADRRLVGLLSETDCLRLLARQLASAP